MSHILSLFLIVYMCAYILPSVLLSLLQIRHIKAALHKPALLLESEDYKEAGSYSIASLKLGLVGYGLNALAITLWVCYGLGALSELLHTHIPHHIWQGIALVLGYVIINAAIELPLSLYKTFWLDKAYGFSKQTPLLFVIDTLKSLALSLVIGGVVVWILILVIERVELWWLAGFGVAFVLALLANFIYPVLIAPLFNKFTPLNDENLKARIESLLQSVGFKSSGIFVIDASRRDGRLNAYFGGFGKTKRVVLFDTLLDKISSDGLIAILGHELGHFKHKDLLKSLVITACVMFLLFFIVGHLPPALFESLGLEQNGASVLITLLLVGNLVSFWAMPLIGYFSRKAEYAADAFGAQISSKNCLANALVRLVNENKAFPSSHPAYIFFYYTHPPLLQRLKALDYDY